MSKVFKNLLKPETNPWGLIANKGQSANDYHYGQSAVHPLSSKGVDTRLTIVDNDLVSKVSGHDEIVFNDKCCTP